MAKLMEAHSLLKKSLGNSNTLLGPTRYARRARRFRPLLVGQDRSPQRRDRTHLPLCPHPSRRGLSSHDHGVASCPKGARR
jgi:hypothetical protein